MANQTTTAGNIEQPKLAQHDSSVLDLAFAMDCTGSMGSYIDTARQNIRRIAEEIVAAEKSDIRFALVEYRDHPPQDTTFVTRVNDFTSSLSKVKQWLDNCSASGGGDAPEAVADALHQLLKLNWREGSTKICVFIADAPPHGLDPSGDSFPNGCPDGLDPLTVTRQIAEKGITIYMVGCEPSIVPYKDFMMTLSFITGGQYVPLSAANYLTQVIIGGAQEEITLERFMEDVNRQVNQEVEASGGVFDEEEISRRVHTEMRGKNIRAKRLNMNKASLPCASTQAKKWSGYTSMTDVQKDVVAAGPPGGGDLLFAPVARGSARSTGVRKMKMKAAAPLPAEEMSFESCEIPSGSDMYDVAEDDISMEQVTRMVKKSKARNKYN